MEIKTNDIWFVVDAKLLLSNVILTFPPVCYTSLEDAKSNCKHGEVPVSAYMLLGAILKSVKQFSA